MSDSITSRCPKKTAHGRHKIGWSANHSADMICPGVRSIANRGTLLNYRPNMADDDAIDVAALLRKVR